MKKLTKLTLIFMLLFAIIVANVSAQETPADRPTVTGISFIRPDSQRLVITLLIAGDQESSVIVMLQTNPYRLDHPQKCRLTNAGSGVFAGICIAPISSLIISYTLTEVKITGGTDGIVTRISEQELLDSGLQTQFPARIRIRKPFTF